MAGMSYIMDMSLLELDDSDDSDGRAELDSHADTCCGGANTVLLERTGRTVTVKSFTPEHNAIENIPIGTIAGAYDSEQNGETYLLVWNESMYFGDRLPITLINPNQIRAAGHMVQDCPKQFDTDSGHKIVTSCNLDIGLKMNGVISYINLRRPTDREVEECVRVEMTSEEPWDPYSQDFKRAEKAANMREISVVGTQGIITPDPGEESTVDGDKLDHVIAFVAGRRIASMMMVEENLLESKLEMLSLMNSHDTFSAEVDKYIGEKDGKNAVKNYCCERSSGSIIGYCCEDCATPERALSSVRVTDRKPSISPATLAERWGIGLDTAMRTLDVTTQLGIRTAVHPVERRFRTAQPHIRRRRLDGFFSIQTPVSLRSRASEEIVVPR